MRSMLLLGALIWAAAFSAACSDVSHLEGKYQSLPTAERFVLLELQPNGQGTWETDFDVVTFRWKVRGQEIWLHTRTGGVLVGRIVGRDHLQIEIPGVGRIDLARQ